MYCGIKGLLLIHCSSIQKNVYSCHALIRSQVLQWASVLIVFPRFLALGANDLVIGTPFDKAGCLHWPSGLVASCSMCRSWCLWGLQRFFNHASTSIDGCYLYIIIHYGISQRDCRIRMVLRGGRPDPESFNATETYIYSKKCTYSAYVCPRIIKIVHMKDESSSSSWIANEWIGSLVLIICL